MVSFKNFLGNVFLNKVERPEKEASNIVSERSYADWNYNFQERTTTYGELSATLNNLVNEEVLIVDDCPSMASVFEAFIGLAKSFFLRFPSAFGVIIKFHGDGDYFTGKQFFETHKAFENFERSFLFAYESSAGNLGCIYWRFENCEQIFYCTIGRNEANLVRFVVDYLLKALKNNRNGLYSQYIQNVHAIEIRVDLSLLIDLREYDLLLLAAEVGNLNVTRILLNRGFDVNRIGYDGKCAADVAYEGNHFDVLIELLEHNSRFPKNFENIDLPDKLRNFVEKSETLHQSIKVKDIETVSQIINEKPLLKHFYNCCNESAVATSLLFKSLDIYKMLTVNQVYVGYYENFDEIVQKLSIEDRQNVRDIHIDIAQKTHIMTLMANSSIGPDDTENQPRLSHAYNAFIEIDKIFEISLILKIIAALKKFSIFFDFKRDDIQYLDPSQDGYTNGLFYTTGTILIAAKNLLNNDKFYDVCGTIAHELCHFAMFKVFDNDAKPYKKKDKKKLCEFTEISEACKELSRTNCKERIIESVYSEYKNNDQQQHAELIVRVPHILAHYQNDPEKLEKLQDSFKVLFEYYKNHCVPTMKKSLSSLLKDEKQQTFTTSIGFLFSLLMITVCAVSCAIIFTPYKQAPVYVWQNLTESLKSDLLSKNVKFQGENVILKDILELRTDAFQYLKSEQLNNLIDGKVLNISEQIAVDFYVERKFIDNDGNNFDQEELFQKHSDFLLSDFPGAGKTTTFKNLVSNLKKKYPTRWISYIDLKRHVEPFGKIKSMDLTYSNAVNFLAFDILKLTLFENEIFQVSLKKNKVTLLWDGIDEIWPTYGEEVMNLIELIRKNTKNQNLLSTRTFLEKGIKESLNIEAYHLRPFNGVDRIVFIDKFMKFKSINTSIEEEMKIIQPFFDKLFNETCDEDNPLMLSMICTIHFDKQKKDGDQELSLLNANLFAVYQRFIEFKLEILSDKGKVVNKDRVKSEQRVFSISEAHQHYAIAFLFPSDSLFMELDIMQQKPDIEPLEISRFGLLEIDNEKTNFIHRTFAEYFLAQFIIQNIIVIKFEPSLEELSTRFKIIHRLMNDINYQLIVVKNFIGYYLKITSDETSMTLSPKIIKKLKTWKLDDLKEVTHHRYNTNSLFKHLEFLASFFGRNYEIFKLYWQIEENENIFMYIFKELKLWRTENREWYERLEKYIVENFSAADVKKLIPWEPVSAKDGNLYDTRIPYSTAYSGILLYNIWKDKIDSNELVEWLLNDEVNKYRNVRTTFEFLQVFNSFQLNKAVKNLLHEEFPNFLIECREEEFPKILKTAKGILTPDELNKALMKNVFEIGMAIHRSYEFTPENLKLLLSYYEQSLDVNEIHEILFFRNSWGFSPLHLVLGFGNIYQTEILWNFIVKYLNKNDIQKQLLLSGTFNGDTALLYAAHSMDKLDMFTKIHYEYFGEEKFKEIIINYTQFKMNFNFLQFFIKVGDDSIDIVNYLKNTIQLSRDEFRTILLTRNKNGENAFTYAKTEGKEQKIEPLKEYLSDDELKNVYKVQPRIRIQEDAPPPCQYKVDIPKVFTDLDVVIERIGIKDSVHRWIQNDSESFKNLIMSINMSELKKVIASVNPEHMANMKKMIDFIINEKISKKYPVAIAKAFSALGSLGDKKVYSNFDPKTLLKLAEVIDVFGGYEKIIEYVPRLKSHRLKMLLSGLNFVNRVKNFG